MSPRRCSSVPRSQRWRRPDAHWLNPVGPACADLQFSGQDDCIDLRQALVTQPTRADIGGGYSQGIGPNHKS